MQNTKIFQMAFSRIYPLYIQKVEKKGKTQQEVDQIIFWLTGYSPDSFKKILETEVTVEDFFNQAPQLNPNVHLITGLICGYRVEEIEDPLMQKIRYLDKLIDELAKGKSMEKILRK